MYHSLVFLLIIFIFVPYETLPQSADICRFNLRFTRCYRHFISRKIPFQKYKIGDGLSI